MKKSRPKTSRHGSSRFVPVGARTCAVRLRCGRGERGPKSRRNPLATRLRSLLAEDRLASGNMGARRLARPAIRNGRQARTAIPALSSATHGLFTSGGVGWASVGGGEPDAATAASFGSRICKLLPTTALIEFHTHTTLPFASPIQIHIVGRELMADLAVSFRGIDGCRPD